jgi:hypothetical protein
MLCRAPSGDVGPAKSTTAHASALVGSSGSARSTYTPSVTRRNPTVTRVVDSQEPCRYPKKRVTAAEVHGAPAVAAVDALDVEASLVLAGDGDRFGDLVER